MDAEHPDLVTRAVYKHYEYMDYKTASKKYTSKLAEKATRITELQREVDYVQLVVDEETWRPKYDNTLQTTTWKQTMTICSMCAICTIWNHSGMAVMACHAAVVHPKTWRHVFVPNEDIDSGRYMDHFWIPSAKTCNRDTKILGIRTNHGTHTYPIGLIANTEPWVNMTRPL